MKRTQILEFSNQIVLVLVFFVGASVHVVAQEGERPRQVTQQSQAEATIVLSEAFFNQFIAAVFTNLRAPKVQFTASGGGSNGVLKAGHASVRNGQCQSEVTVEREVGGVKTAVRLEGGRVIAPVAFSGTYSAAVLGCVPFKGWADTVIKPEFDASRQAVVARAEVQDIHLEGMLPVATNALKPLVQSQLDRRFNPVELFKTSQVSPVIPIKEAGGSLQLRAKDIRVELLPGEVRMHIFYEFAAAQGQ